MDYKFRDIISVRILARTINKRLYVKTAEALQFSLLSAKSLTLKTQGLLDASRFGSYDNGRAVLRKILAEAS